MRRLVGFALVFVAVGMIVMMFIPDLFVGILTVALCLVVGYLLFCG
ncbi:MAG TPA: hypothetical protein H9782_06260 [Candidatus Bariatricus faecipullorum]|mgnify:FL=1|nr:hypothetical protein [Candidatus Bariatricus faecipullorum]